MENIRILSKILKYIPAAQAAEISEIAREKEICELRLRPVRSSVMASDGSVTYIDRPMNIEGIYASLCRGAPYAYRDSVARGYIPLESGVRIGVSGRARYDGGRLVGIGEVSSLVFRIPTGRCDFADEIYALCKDKGGGVLIFSPPGGGKTTALRSLACSLSEDRRVVIVDEREEIYTDELSGREIDVLSGYRRGYGISLATRCLSPDVILTDEISAEDARELLSAANSGVPIIATAHAASLSELMRREGMRRLFDDGVFESAVGIYRSNGSYLCREESL